jgi:ferredoxin-NADP reductase
MAAHMVSMAGAMRTRIDGQAVVRQLHDAVDPMQVNPRFGVAAFVLWTWVMVTSLSYFRRKAWGWFYAGHFIFLPAAVMTLLHTRCVASVRSALCHCSRPRSTCRPAHGPWLIAAAVTFFTDLCIRAYMKFMRKSEVREATVLPGGVAKLVVATGNGMVYEPGQYVWIAFVLKDGPELLQSLSFHPFSISSAHAAGDKTYTLHIKMMGPGTWSEAVVKAAKGGAEAFKGGCRVGGPAGRFSIDPAHFEHIVLVAGGIGFTPLVSLLAAIVRDAASETGTKEAPAQARRYAAVKHITVVWAVQTAACLSWFADELDACRAASNVAVDLQLYVTRAAKGDAEGHGGFVAGRPDVAASLASAAAQHGAAAPVGVFACGPSQLLEDTRNAVAAANAGSRRFLLHQETFLF